MITFILGASDPEMQFIKEVLQLTGYPYALATYNDKPVKSSCAYKANGILGKVTGYPVFVECDVHSISPTHVIDHHRKGDPGYDKTPDKFWQASSLGQTISFLVRSFDVNMEEVFGARLTDYRFAAAADHCLTAAYQGLCPDINPEDLAFWRAGMRSQNQGVPLDQLLIKIKDAKRAMDEARTINIDGVDVALIDKFIPELREASAQMNKAFQSDTISKGLRRRNIMSATPHVVRAWLKQAEKDGLKNIYGDPQRGFAGGFYQVTP